MAVFTEILNWILKLIPLLGSAGVGIGALIYSFRRKKNGGNIHQKLDRIEINLRDVRNRVKKLEGKK